MTSTHPVEPSPGTRSDAEVWRHRLDVIYQHLATLQERAGPARPAVGGLPTAALAARYHAAVTQALRRGFDEGHAQLVEGALAAQALDARAARRVSKRLARGAPPAYLVAALGPYPPATDPQARAVWREGARRVECYRLLYRVTDPDRPFGDPGAPLAGWQQAERSWFEAQVAQARTALAAREAHQAWLRELLAAWQAAQPAGSALPAGRTLPALAEELHATIEVARQAWPPALRDSAFLAREVAMAWLDGRLATPTAGQPTAEPESEILTNRKRAEAVELFSVTGDGGTVSGARLPEVSDAMRRWARGAPSTRLREELARADGALLDATLATSEPGALPLADRYLLGRARLAVAELLWREASALERLAAHPPAYLAALGRPLDPAQHGRYRDALRAVAAYRRERNVTDPAHPLGPRPAAPLDRAAWDAAAERLRAYLTSALRSFGYPDSGLDIRYDTAAILPPHTASQARALLVLADIARRFPGPAPLALTAEFAQLRALPTAALTREVDRAARTLARRPRDRSAELAELEAQHAGLLEAQASTQQDLARTQREIEACSGSRLPTARAHRRELEVEASLLEGTLAQLKQQRARAGERLEGLRAGQAAWVAWQAAGHPGINRGVAAAAELLRRDEALLAELEAAQLTYLHGELGRLPSTRAGRLAWLDGARTITFYRLDHGVTHPEAALGEPTAALDGAQQAARQAAAWRLSEARVAIAAAEGFDLPSRYAEAELSIDLA